MPSSPARPGRTTLAASSPRGTISVGLVREALQVARERAIDVAGVLAHAGIAAELLDAPKARISAAAYAQLWAALADAMDDEFFGMDRHPMRRGSFQLMCQAALQARSLERALHRMCAWLHCVLDEVRLELHTEGDRAILRVRESGPPRRMFTYATLLLLVHGLSCWLVRRRIPLTDARFRCPMPPEVEDYRARFSPSTAFDAPVTEISIDAAFLSLKPTASELGLQSFLGGAPANLLVKYRDDASLAAQIRRRLRRQLPAGWLELNALAQDLHLAPTTLQRRLQAEGTSFQEVKDALRRDIAIDLLSSSSRSVGDVAAEVGFLETSAFHRAFKKWTGVSPGAYRNTTRPS